MTDNIRDPETGLPVEIKQPWEEFWLDMDLSPRMREGDTIATVDEVVIANQNKVVGSSDLTKGGTASSGAIAQVHLSGGTSPENYKITWRCTTAAGDKVEGDGMVWVRD